MLRTVLSLLLVICFSGSLLAQNFFWSLSGFGEGAVNDDFSGVIGGGESGTVYLYYDANGQQDISDGLELEFSWLNPGVVDFTAAETLEFDVSIMGTSVGQRWGDIAGPAESVAPDSVTGFLAMNAGSGSGIQVDQIPGNGVFEDNGYDASADAFLVGSFDFLGNRFAPTGIVIDKALVFDDGKEINVPFKELCINSFLCPVPEPNFASLSILWFLAVVNHRTKRTG